VTEMLAMGYSTYWLALGCGGSVIFKRAVHFSQVEFNDGGFFRDDGNEGMRRLICIPVLLLSYGANQHVRETSSAWFPHT
jgi:hypothetical protein